MAHTDTQGRTLPEIASGTPVFMIGHTAPEQFSHANELTPGEVRVGLGFVRFITTRERVAPVAACSVVPVKAGADGVEVRKFEEGHLPYLRRLWLAKVDGVFVEFFKTKAEALAACAVASAVLRANAQALELAESDPVLAEAVWSVLTQ